MANHIGVLKTLWTNLHEIYDVGPSLDQHWVDVSCLLQMAALSWIAVTAYLQVSSYCCMQQTTVTGNL